MAIKASIIFGQGEDYSTTIDVTDDNDVPINLTGYSGAAMMRKHYTSLNAYSFSVTISPLIGAVTLSMSSNSSYANSTGNIPAGRYVYDCELTDQYGKKTRLVEGFVTVTPQVTR